MAERRAKLQKLATLLITFTGVELGTHEGLPAALTK